MPSQYDDLYFQLFGQRLTKEGQAFERLAAAVTKIVAPHLGVEADARLRGVISRSLYQIDVLATDAGGKSFGEAKDYSQRGQRVGRPDIQKLAGALVDVDVQGAVFFSSTGYTREAKRYANASEKMIGKTVQLMHLRKSVDQDEDGRIKRIVINLHLSIPDMNKAQFKPVLTDNALRRARSWMEANNVDRIERNLRLSEFFDESGKVRISMHELTSSGYGGDEASAWASFWLPGHFVKVNDDLLLELHGLEYRVPFRQETQTIEVVATGKPMILIKSEDGKVNKLVTDKHLKAIRFAPDGDVYLPED